MLPLLTGNPQKYAPLSDLLGQLEIRLQKPPVPWPELQHEDFLAVLEHKARQAHDAIGGPCLVDDSGLLLDAYPGFPGPMTRAVCKQLGAQGLARLLHGVTTRAKMVCHLGCWIEGTLWHWQGEVAGTLDPSRVADPNAPSAGPLTAWFVPDEPAGSWIYIHRRRALEALGRDMPRLRQALGQRACKVGSPAAAMASCVFCNEFEGSASSIFQEMMGPEFISRILHRTDHFFAFPPLGHFVEGGLLLTTREHLYSMADLPDSYYDELESLMAETTALLGARYGCPPVFFEHAPIAPGQKGTCCVDHAHLNVFPVRVDVHEQLKKFPHRRIAHMRELSADQANQGYLFLQANDGSRYVYHAGVVPSQYVRKIITAQLGMPERWHWREYPGVEELKRTMKTLSGWRN